jgi:hypothetical protein
MQNLAHVKNKHKSKRPWHKASSNTLRTTILSVAVVFLVAFLAIPAARVLTTTVTQASTTYTSTANPLQSSVISWNVNWGKSATSSYFIIQVSATGNYATTAPQKVLVAAKMTLNGTAYWTGSMTLSYAKGQTSASTTFTVPFKTGGDYTFYATFVSASNGNLNVAKQVVDPKIEPQWK